MINHKGQSHHKSRKLYAFEQEILLCLALVTSFIKQTPNNTGKHLIKYKENVCFITVKLISQQVAFLL